MSRILAAVLASLLALSMAAPGWAVEPDEILPDKKLEARARTISEGLRCLVCQNQSIDDSAAPLAKDLRLLVRERLKAGDTNQQVVDFIVSRYGDFVLLRPPFKLETLLLWLTPVLLLAGTGFYIALRLRRPATPGPAGTLPSPPPLTDDERARLDKLLRDSEA